MFISNINRKNRTVYSEQEVAAAEALSQLRLGSSNFSNNRNVNQNNGLNLQRLRGQSISPPNMTAAGNQETNPKALATAWVAKRMAKTGESYEDARSNLENNPDFPKGEKTNERSVKNRIRYHNLPSRKYW